MLTFINYWFKEFSFDLHLYNGQCFKQLVLRPFAIIQLATVHQCFILYLLINSGANNYQPFIAYTLGSLWLILCHVTSSESQIVCYSHFWLSRWKIPW